MTMPPNLSVSALLIQSLPLLFIGGIGIAVYYMSQRKKAKVEVEASQCIGCSFCYHECPEEAIQIVARDTLDPPHNTAHASGVPYPSIAVINASKCSTCGKCLEVCEFNALTVQV
ncbi:MAG: DUF362 domain-containing protein [Vampirovibrionales bacterium]